MRLAAEAYAELLCSLLAEGRPVLTTVHGGSMSPAIPDGSTVRIEPIDGPRVGEVVVRRGEGGRLVCHRLASVAGDRLQTWGDACLLPDPPTDAAALVGRVVAAEVQGVRLTVLVRPRWRMAWRYLKLRLRRGLSSPASSDELPACQPGQDA